jgi:glutaredoxin 3
MPMTDPVLVLYSLRECPHCEAAREFLRGRGIAFVERDVREEAGAIRDLARLTGESVVPTIALGDDVQVGWDAARVAEMLDNPLPPEEEDLLLAVIEEAIRSDSEEEEPADWPRLASVPTSAGTSVEEAEVRTGPSRAGKDCTSPAE